MSKAKNAKLKAVEKDMAIEDQIHAMACDGRKDAAPTLRWLTIKKPTWFRKGFDILQYKDTDGVWKDVPQVDVE